MEKALHGVIVVKKNRVLIISAFVVVGMFFVFKLTFPISTPEKLSGWHVFEKDESKDYFVFVIDHSLSIKEREMGQLIKGFKQLADEMPSKASASIVIFNERVEHILPMTNDNTSLVRRLSGIKPDGFSAFHDGLVKAIQVLNENKGRRAIFFFTDGIDDRSGYKLDQVEKIAVSEGVKVYGVGIGDIDKERLMAFSRATGGIFGKMEDYRSLSKVFPYMLNHYYDAVNNRTDSEGEMIVRSIPDNKKVYLDGVLKGVTPLRLPKIVVGKYTVKVVFDVQKEIVYMAPVEAGKRTVLDIRPSGTGRDIVLASMPGRAAAFIDGTYAGMTGKFNKEYLRENWRSALDLDSERLVVKNVSFGKHSLTFPGKPELNSGLGFDISTRSGFNLNRSKDDAAIVAVLFSKAIRKTNLKKHWNVESQ